MCVCSNWLFTPRLFLLSFILLYKAVLHALFLSFILSHCLHRYLYNYFVTKFSHFLLCCFFWDKFNKHPIFTRLAHGQDRYCNNCYSSTIDTFYYLHIWPFKQLEIKWKSKSCTVFIGSAPSFFEVAHMLYKPHFSNSHGTEKIVPKIGGLTNRSSHIKWFDQLKNTKYRCCTFLWKNV